MFDSIVVLFQQDPKIAAIIAVCFVAFYALEKAVHLSPSKKDDIVLDCIVAGIKKLLMPQNPKSKSKLLLLLIGLFVAPLSLSACGALTTADSSYTWPNECYTDGTLNSDAIIPSLITSPSTTSLTLRLANTAAITAGLYTTDQALAVIDAIEEFANSAETYARLASYVLTKVNAANSAAGVTIFVTTATLFADYTTPITSCDLAIIKLHLEKERAIVQALVTTGTSEE